MKTDFHYPGGYRIALLYYADGEKTYIIAPEGIKVDQTLISGDKVAPEVGNALPIGNIPLGTIVHNICPRCTHEGFFVFTLKAEGMSRLKRPEYKA